MCCVLCVARVRKHTHTHTHTRNTHTHTHTGITQQSVSSITGDVVEFRDLAVRGAIGQFLLAHIFKQYFQY